MEKTIQVIGWTGLIVVVLFAMTALPCLAADSAVLRNGFSIRHERRQIIGTITRLFVDGGNSSFVDIPTAEIDHFENAPDETVATLVPVPEKQPQRPMDLNEVVRE